MDSKNYISSYLEQSNLEISKESNPTWIKSFFKVFSEALTRRKNNASSGDRYVITGSFKEAFDNLIPIGLTKESEVEFKKLLQIDANNEVDKMLMKKKIDYVIHCKEKTILIEFKTNFQFNDLAAAMIEMAAVKKYEPSSDKRIITSSMHLYPSNVSIEGLKGLNEMFGSPLEKIWIFCKGPELKFDVSEIIKFRNELANSNELKL